MRILIISGQEYSKTNRSIDTMTEYFLEKKYKVDHLVFGINKLRKRKKITEFKAKSFKQLYSQESYFSYFGLMGRVFPNFLLKFIQNKTNETVNKIKFMDYNLIVLETGIPLLLIEKLPKNIPVILRQSDPLKISIGSDKKFFKNLEKVALENSSLFLAAHEGAVKNYTNNKIVIWKSGFEYKNIEKNKEEKNKEEKNICYMGGFGLDYKLIENIASKNLNLKINIIGNYKDKIKLPNVFFHGYLNYEKYIEILKKTDCFFVPYSDKEIKRMQMLGLTSKFYIAMSLGIPILTREFGTLSENNKLNLYNIFTYKYNSEAESKLKNILKNNYNINQDIKNFLENLTIENRKKELEKIFKNYKII